MKTIVYKNKKAADGKYQHYFCPYCAKLLNPPEIKELKCNRCKSYLTGSVDGGLYIEN